MRPAQQDYAMRAAVNNILRMNHEGNDADLVPQILDTWNQYFCITRACKKDMDVLEAMLFLAGKYDLKFASEVKKEIARIQTPFILPRGDTHFARYTEQGQYQEAQLKKCYEYIKNWDVAVDVGGHVGFWANNLASQFQQVHSFEPNPSTYECLKKNSYENVRTYNFGLGNVSETKFLAHPEYHKTADQPENSGGWEIHGQPGRGDLGHGNLAIQIKTLDSLGLFPDFIKVDVQGYEMHVLGGGRKTISGHKPVICIECYSRGLVNNDVIRFCLDQLGMVLMDTIGKEFIFGWPDANGSAT